jgi:HAE1 family hydrophobic/amphiphilic exporter-1
MNTLSTLVGSIEISFIKYGINYKVIVQAFQSTVHCQRIFETLRENDRDEMVPYSAHEVRKSIWIIRDY